MGLSVPVTFYVRRDCHLCEEVERTLVDFAGRFVMTLEYRDVDTRAEWRREFGQEVPVVFVGEEKVSRFRLDPAEFETRVLDYLNRLDDTDHT